MSIPGAASPLFLAATAAGPGAGFEISRSLRFNTADSSKLTRTPSSSGNRKTWTMSYWVKRARIGEEYMIFSAAESSSNRVHFYYPNSDLIAVYSHAFYYTLPDVARDPAAWQHLVFACDTTQSTDTNRFKIYKNGVLADSYLNQSHPAQNLDTTVNGVFNHQFSGRGYISDDYADAYLAEVNFVDGAQLDATSFGEFDDNGVWQAKDTSGLTFGTNGFRLKFADNSSNAALGTDSSGNSNTFTVNNLTAAVPGLATANQGFDVVTWTGNGAAQSMSLAFQPDLVWIKSRSDSQSHALMDSVRGPSKQLRANTTGAEATSSTAFTSFDSNGFTVNNNNISNQSGKTYVAWCWKAGGAASSNTDGTITSSVSANTTYGFSIVSYTGTFSAGTIGHGLNGVVKMIIVKNRDTTNDWNVYHVGTDASNPGQYHLRLNDTNARATGSGKWNDTSPTSSVFSVADSNTTNGNGNSFIAYCWSEVAGFSKFGSWTGNSSSNGPTVTLGFKPRYVLFKRTDTSGDTWTIFDTARDSGTLNIGLEANDNSAEQTYGNRQIVVSDTGFQVTSTGDSSNAAGGTYIYAAYAAKPNGEEIDSLVDSPSNGTASSGGDPGGSIVGNYATLNPLISPASTYLSDGNLKIAATTNSWVQATSTIGVNSGKWYWEVLYEGTNTLIGVTSNPNSGSYIGEVTGSYGRDAGGGYYINGGNGSGFTSFASGTTLGVALDMDNGTVTLYFNGSAESTFATGLDTSKTFYAGVSVYGSTSKNTINFGQRAFAHAAPSGYKSLNTANLPTPTIADGSKYFDTKLYTGNGGTQTVSGLEFSPSFVWFKNRASSVNHHLLDVVRGAGNGTNVLYSNLTNAEGATDSLTAFTSDGFTVGSNDSVNKNNNAIAAWAWDAGTSTVTNNDGSIASQVRVNQTAGFSIVTYTGASGNQSFGHGLNVKPKFIAIKNRSSSANWFAMFDTGAASYQYGHLNTSDLFNAATAQPVTNSTVTLGNNNSWFGAAGDNYIAYCFAPVAGYSATGSYTGGGEPFVFTGFRPSWVLIKGSSHSGNWGVWDTARDTFNVSEKRLQPNYNGQESSGDANVYIDILSNGFKIKNSDTDSNGSGRTYIYFAFASNPFASNGGLAR